MQEEPESNPDPDASYKALQIFVGLRVREARKRAKLSQRELAKSIGSGQSYIFQIEAGEANLTLKTLLRIAAAIGLSPRDFLPHEHSNNDQIAEAVCTTMHTLDRASQQLRELHKLVADDLQVQVPDTRPES